MAKQSLSNEFELIGNSLAKTISIIYSSYADYFKIFLLFAIAYAFYRVGKLTVSDSIDHMVKDLSTTLQSRAVYTMVIPQKIKKISTAKKIFLGLFGMGVVAIAVV